MIRSLIILWALVISSIPATAQPMELRQLLSFEDTKALNDIQTSKSKIDISSKHFKHGTSSIHWNFKANGILTLSKDIEFEPKDATGKDTYLSAFIVWVYNEKPLDAQIRFSFLKNGKPCCSFPMNINYKGWRGVWVCYERDMEGTPQVGMNQLRVEAPKTAGNLYFDHMILATKVDARQQTADIQVPFVNKETRNHWLQIYNNSLKKPQTPFPALIPSHVSDIKMMEKRFMDIIYSPGKLTPKTMENMRKQYQKYHIERKNGYVTGTPVFFVRHAEAYERLLSQWDKNLFIKAGVEMGNYFKLMNQVATAYHHATSATDKGELKDMFLNLYDHITDQGVVYGSCWGNIHHYGYSLRQMFPAYYLMREVLRESGRSHEAEQTLLWYAQTNSLYDVPTENGADMDTFNTEAIGCMASILLMEDGQEKVGRLQAFSRWIDNGCRPADGLKDALKIDGSAYHHCHHYPAYAIGGLTGITQMAYVLRQTSFKIGTEAHRTIRKALLAMRMYCNKRHFPLAMSGRHPDGLGELIPLHYALMAMTGCPENGSEIDTTMAAAYLRLALPKKSYLEKQIWKTLQAQGLKAEQAPQGNLAMPYACASIHRRGEWSAVAVGHSRYLWAAEHYNKENLYGRYLAHGSLQLLTSQEGDVTPLTSGWQQAGFDWSHIPGTTATILPFHLLKARIYNVDTFSGLEEMLLSDQSFAGGLSQQGRNGNFGMILHENEKYNGSLWAHKSFHFIDGTIVCLGSDIKNKVAEYPTETTILQQAVSSSAQHDYWNQAVDSGNTCMDALSTGYYYPDGATLRKNFPQLSRAEDTGKETKGDWVSLVIEHGKAPKNAQYQYAILPNTTQKQLSAFAKAPTYEVLQQDSIAHIIHSTTKHITSYVVWKATATPLSGELVSSIDTPCLLMTNTPKSTHLTLTIAQPDLALYRGKSDEQYDEQGKWIERSIYSRPWTGNKSQIVPVTLTIKGKWELQNPSGNVKTSIQKDTTTILIETQDGTSYDLEFIKQ
uniref:Chondroitinase family polysaccharide lyase n=1 Tax=Prevotella sp. GTC17262 TaxID=3236797 RepID=A0AB33JMQ0_9BACT